MCGRYALSTPAAVIAEHFELLDLDELELPPRFNIAPTQTLPVVRLAADGTRELVAARWGLIPSWAKDPAIGNRLINARAESAADKPAFRSAFRRRRCLVPATGFYEWQRLEKRKQPYQILMRDGGLFAMAGLWERWQCADSAPLDTYTILTTAANPVVAPLHDRMPVILAPGDYDLWLGRTPASPQALSALLHPYPATAMTAYPVSSLVNSPRNDGPACAEPLVYPDLG
jgi:putative SOS response-associated peptidase YedK